MKYGEMDRRDFFNESWSGDIYHASSPFCSAQLCASVEDNYKLMVILSCKELLSEWLCRTKYLITKKNLLSVGVVKRYFLCETKE
ncbi:unnamed protein product [Heterobilharzia americana]|nr:unnamed protein product [Heterobilharzia americana]